MSVRAAVGAAAVALALAGCASASPPPAPPSGAAPRARHAQIFRAASAQAGAELFARFRARNGPAWALDGDPADAVDPFRPFVRRARRRDPQGPPVELDPRQAEGAAAAWVARNADLLALARAEVPSLAVEAFALEDVDFAFSVRVHGAFPMRGYDAFEDVATVVDLVVLLGRDGEPRVLLNRSRVHPRLSLDTRAPLAPDDPRVVAQIVGRRVFALVSDPRRPGARARELRRLPLGEVEPGDLRLPRLTIHASPGPALAWMTYRLAYLVDGVKEADGPLFFRWVVDAESGQVIEDARPPRIGGPF